MVWSLALCPEDAEQDSVVYGAEFGVVFMAKGPRTASIQEILDCLLPFGSYGRALFLVGRRANLGTVSCASNMRGSAW